MPFSAGALFLCSATHKTSALGLSRSGTSYMVPSLALLASSHRRGHLLSHKSSFYLSCFLYFLCNSSQLLRCWSFLGVSCNLPPGYHAYRVICTPSYIYLSSFITSFGARVGCGVGDCRKKAKSGRTPKCGEINKACTCIMPKGHMHVVPNPHCARDLGIRFSLLAGAQEHLKLSSRVLQIDRPLSHTLALSFGFGTRFGKNWNKTRRCCM